MRRAVAGAGSAEPVGLLGRRHGGEGTDTHFPLVDGDRPSLGQLTELGRKMPLFDANEMANPGKQELFERLRHAPYADEFRAAVSAPGEDVLADPESSVIWMTIASATFEQTPAELHPFTSNCDAYLRDEVLLSTQEQRGLALFTDIKMGNRASCHPSTGKDPARNFPVFTDFGYTALGVPRNRELAVNHDPAFFDMGLCGPVRTDFKERTEYCGMFRTPTLRNVALRKRFFHNGAVRTLRDAVSFYATRDTAPQKWYPKQMDGRVEAFDDLPAAFRANVNREIPFRPLPGIRPRRLEADVDVITAFLRH